MEVLQSFHMIIPIVWEKFSNVLGQPPLRDAGMFQDPSLTAQALR